MSKRLLFCGLPAVAAALLALPLFAQQDGDSAAPPAPPADYSAPPVQDNGAPAPDDAAGASDGSATFQTFYDSLSSQGTWIQSADYGYVWQPQVNDPDWAPYTEGHWVYTDEGWTWVSDESFGWATYHYGRWVNLDGTGWCWVPGYTWAPAWVSWRYGNGYAGWAPLPPDSFYGVDYSDDGYAIGVGFHIGGDCDGFYGIGAGCYNFVPVNCLGYRNYHGYYRNRGDNFAIINHTTNVTNINVTRGGASVAAVTAGGPMLEQVNAASANPVQRVNLVRSRQVGGGGTLTGNSLALFAPRVSSGSAGAPAQVAGSIGKTSINRGADVMRPLAVNARLAGATATEAQVQQARIAQDHAPANAKVMTDEASVRPVLQAPLTSLKPVASPVRTFNPAASEFSHTERAPAAPVYAPATRVYSETGQGGTVAPRVYYPNTVSPSGGASFQTRPGTTTSTGGGAEAHTYVRPAAPAGSYSVAPSTSTVHQSQGGSSGGGSAHGSSSGGSSGGGGGGFHSGGGSPQGH